MRGLVVAVLVLLVYHPCASRPVEESVVSVYTTLPTATGSLDVYRQIAGNIADRITQPIYRFFGLENNTKEEKTTKRPFEHIELYSTELTNSDRTGKTKPTEPGRIGTSLSEPGKIGTSLSEPGEIGTSLSEPGKIGTSVTEPGKIGTSLSEPGKIGTSLTEPKIDPQPNEIPDRDVEELSADFSQKSDKKPEKITLFSSYLPVKGNFEFLNDTKSDENDNSLELDDVEAEVDDASDTGRGPFVYILELIASIVQLLWGGFLNVFRPSPSTNE